MARHTVIRWFLQQSFRGGQSAIIDRMTLHAFLEIQSRTRLSHLVAGPDIHVRTEHGETRRQVVPNRDSPTTLPGCVLTANTIHAVWCDTFHIRHFPQTYETGLLEGLLRRFEKDLH